MAKQDISKLKEWFSTGKYPTQEQFSDWMDSYIHKDDKLGIVTNFPELDQVLQQKADKGAFGSHESDRANPHGVTKAQVGLGNVDNTADADKQVSIATQAALDLKGSKNILDDHLASQANPHGVTKAQIGLGNADNTSDTDKPVSRATEIALYQKSDKGHTHTVNTLTGFDTDANLSANSDEKVASQKAVKAYVDNQVATASSKQLGNKLDKSTSFAGEVTGNYASTVVDTVAIMGKPLTNLVIPSTASPIGVTDKLIDALGKLQGQINRGSSKITSTSGTTTLPVMKFEQGSLLTIPQNGAWEWDGKNLYFTVQGARQNIIKNPVFSSQKTHEGIFEGKQSGFSEISSDVAPAGILSKWGLAKLHALFQINIASRNVASSKFHTATDVFLQIKNGVFSYLGGDYRRRTDTVIRIATISFASDWKLKEIDLPILSLPYDSGKGSTLVISGINDIDGVKSDFQIITALNNRANTETISAEAASFCLLAKSRMATTTEGDTLNNNVTINTCINSFTLTRVNEMSSTI